MSPRKKCWVSGTGNPAMTSLSSAVRLKRRKQMGFPGSRDTGRASVVALMILLMGCQPAPTAQLNAFTASLTAVQEANKPIFADLALAEARGNQARPDACPDLPQLAVPGAQPVRNGFCMKDVAATADIVDPPATASFKGGMEALLIYTGTLNTLASGASASDTAAQLQTAAGNLVNIASTLSLIGGAASPAISGAISALAPLVTQAAQQLSKAEARRLILSGDQYVRDLIAAERNAVPSIWNVITGDWRRQLARISPHDAQTGVALRDKIETYRTIMANYVVMLNRLDAAWAATVKATNDPQPATLADLTALTDQLKADSDALAKAYASLRRQ